MKKWFKDYDEGQLPSKVIWIYLKDTKESTTSVTLDLDANGKFLSLN